jgi:hypothetical protein
VFRFLQTTLRPLPFRDLQAGGLLRHLAPTPAAVQNTAEAFCMFLALQTLGVF